MQAVKVSCLAQTFALAKISNSRERKPRSRKTREERKVMVESFVKKYQNSNNGSFPSLNLTHKEVGGSFYTIREIVRELIQENRVLGPGSPTSKVLKLESGSEDDEVEPFSMDLPSDMCTSTIGHAINQKQMQLLEEHHARTEINVDIAKSEPQETFSSHNEISFSEDRSIDTSNYVENSFTDTHLNAIVADDIADPVEPSVDTPDILKNSENMEAEQPASPSISAMSSLGAFLVNGNDGTNNLAKPPDTSLENDVPMITGEDNLPENKIPEDSLPESKLATSSSIGSISNKLLDPSVSIAVEVFPIPSSANNLNRRFIEMECAKEEEVPLLDVKDPVINGSGSTENQPINKEEPAIQTSPESGVFEPSATRTTKIELDSLVTDNHSLSGEPVSAQVIDTPQVQVQVQSSDTSYSTRKSTEKDIRDSKPSEINPLWSAITAFVTAVFKFLS